MTVENQKTYVRDLAKKVAELAAAPDNIKRIERIKNINGLQPDDPPVVVCPPLHTWEGLYYPDGLRTENPFIGISKPIYCGVSEIGLRLGTICPYQT